MALNINGSSPASTADIEDEMRNYEFLGERCTSLRNQKRRRRKKGGVIRRPEWVIKWKQSTEG